MGDSTAAGFLQPHPQPPAFDTVPPKLTLVQFIQTFLVGLSALPATLVRPAWQQNPPAQPDIDVNWIGFGVKEVTPDANAYTGLNADEVYQLQRNELIEVGLSIYGPNSYDLVGLIRDGAQIGQNLASLLRANMGYAYESPANHSPDFVNGRWVDRFVMSMFLRRQILREYPVVSFLSATGTIYTQTAEDRNYQLSWST